MSNRAQRRVGGRPGRKAAAALAATCGIVACTLPSARTEAQAAPAPPETSNLIANPGVETSSKGAPQRWTPESWGASTTTFRYLDTGHTGGHAVQTTVSDYQSGDSKWMFDPVSVTPGISYTYQDWYQATADSDLWAEYAMADGTRSHVWLGGIGASAAWAPSVTKFTVPDDATSVRVFHVLATNGQLTIDDASLVVTPVCNTSQSHGIYNGGFEDSCPGDADTPANWHHETFGNPVATFGYAPVAHSGRRAVLTTVAGPGGEAGWQSDWQGADGNQRYDLNFAYDGSTYVYAYVTIRLTDGSLHYLSLMSVPATQDTGWSRYDDRFVTPPGTAEIQVTIATSGVGSFALDDIYIDTLANQTPADFDRGVVSVTFDDGDASSYANAFPILSAMGMRATFYVNASALGTDGYMTGAEVQNLAAHGQEIGSHLYQHVDAVTLDDTELRHQITANTAALHGLLGPDYAVSDVATPYGSYTSSDVDVFMDYYRSHRTTDGELNSKADLNPRHIHAVLVQSSTPLSDVQSWIARAKASHEWLVLVYHAIGASPLGGDGEGYAVTPANFAAQMNALAASGVTVLPVAGALDLLGPQAAGV